MLRSIAIIASKLFSRHAQASLKRLRYIRVCTTNSSPNDAHQLHKRVVKCKMQSTTTSDLLHCCPRPAHPLGRTAVSQMQGTTFSAHQLHNPCSKCKARLSARINSTNLSQIQGTTSASVFRLSRTHLPIPRMACHPQDPECRACLAGHGAAVPLSRMLGEPDSPLAGGGGDLRLLAAEVGGVGRRSGFEAERGEIG